MAQKNAFVRQVRRWLQGGKASNHNTSGPVIDSVAICMVRNEQDIVEPFVRHTAGLVDLVVILDNCSTDATRAILTKTARALGNVVVTDLTDQGYNQAQTMTRALQHIQPVVFADFVFFLDADEFLDAKDTSALLQPLRGLAPMTTGLLPWKTYLPDPALSEGDHPDPLDRLTLRRTTEAPQYHKAVLRMAGGFDPLITVAQGNHKLRGRNGRPLPSQVIEDLDLLHFPLRSVDQLLAKGLVGWGAHSKRAKGKSSKAAYQWKRLHDLASNGTLLSAQGLLEEALIYAQDEKPGAAADHMVADRHGIKGARSFSDGSFADPTVLARAAQAETLGKRMPFTLPPTPVNTKEETEVSNAFEGDWHWDYLFLDEAPIRFALERFAPASVLDLGCGNGLYPALYDHLGVQDVLGVDGIQPEATVLGADQYARVDLQEPFDVGRKFDLVFCLEVMEHIRPETSDTLFDTIARHAQGQIVFSMAQVGQPGNGHINCKDMAEVLEAWAARGWQPNLPATLGARAVSSMSWFRRNIVVLEQKTAAQGAGATAALLSIGAFDYKWYSQKAGQRAVAFMEEYPEAPKAYGIVTPAALP